MPLERMRRRGAFELADAASAAFAAPPDLLTNERPALGARIAVAVLARAARISLAEVVEALGIRRRSVRRLSEYRPDPRGLRAVRMRLALELLVHVDVRRT